MGSFAKTAREIAAKEAARCADLAKLYGADDLLEPECGYARWDAATTDHNEARGSDLSTLVAVSAQMMAALDQLAEVFGDMYAAHDLGQKFTCRESDVIAAALLEADHQAAAEEWIAAHAEGDDEGDWHFDCHSKQAAAGYLRRLVNHERSE